MIISYEHNYIFIKTAKVAGTSIEMALSRHCGPRDVITPIYPRNEIHRKPPMRWPQNFSTDPALERAYAETAARGDIKTLWKQFRELEGKSNFYNHMEAKQIRERVDGDFWHSAFKFTIERNPYDAIVSNAFWRFYHDHGHADSKPQEIRKIIETSIRNFKPNRRLYTIDGVVAVDRILRYENLRADLAEIADRVGGDISANLPRAKSGARRPDQTADVLLTADQRRRIAERHAATFALLGYPTEL